MLPSPGASANPNPEFKTTGWLCKMNLPYSCIVVKNGGTCPPNSGASEEVVRCSAGRDPLVTLCGALAAPLGLLGRARLTTTKAALLFATLLAAHLRRLCYTFAAPLMRLWQRFCYAFAASLLRFWAAPLRRLCYAFVALLRRFCCAFGASVAAPWLRLDVKACHELWNDYSG